MSSIKKNYVYNVISQLLTIIMPLITTPYISRVLGADGIGIYSYNYSIANYFALFIMLGLNNYGSRRIAEIRDNKNELSINFVNIYVMQFFMGIIMSGLYLAYCFIMANDFSIAIIMNLYVISAMFDVNWFFCGIEQFKVTVFRNSMVKIVSTIAILILVKKNTDIPIYCLIMVLSILASQLLVWPLLLNTVNICKPRWIEVKKHIKPNLVLFITVIATSLFKIMDKIMLGIMSDYQQVGFYEVSEKIINIPIAFVVALGTVTLPRTANLIAKKKYDVELLNKSIFFLMTISISLSFGIMSVADVFVGLFYGEGYETCIGLYMILLPSCIFLAFANVIRTQYLLPYKMDRVYMISAFVGAITNLSINMILIPTFKSYGAAMGTLIAEAAVCFFQCFSVKSKLPFKKYVIQLIPVIFSAVVMFICVQYITIESISRVSLLLIKILVGAFIFIMLLLMQIYIFREKYKTIINSMVKITKRQ